MNFWRTAIVVLLAGALKVSSVDAQSLMLGGGIESSTDRFSGDAALNRLDGTTGGWMVLGGVGLGPLVVRVEGSRDAEISDVETASLIVNGRPVTIRSELAHDRRAVAALAGVARDVTPGVMVAVVAGVSFVTIHRTFTTNAGEQLLVTPSTRPPADSNATLVDRFTTWSVGADVFVPVSRDFRMIAGFRFEPLTLEVELTGRNIRALAGVVWVR